jgi:hypothetical protein
VGKEAVKMGSKIAARYSASIGEVLDDAMIELSWGSRALFLFRELVSLQQGTNLGW